MAVIEKFLGQRVTIPEDLRYVPKQGLWARQENQTVFFGFTEPALVLSGGINDLNYLISDDETVEKGQTVFFAITGKISYIETPLPGAFHGNPLAASDPSVVNQDPYGQGWLFSVTGAEMDFAGLPDFTAYMEHLKESEGFKNPDGVKGGVSGVCKAVYSGIRMQKLPTS